MSLNSLGGTLFLTIAIFYFRVMLHERHGISLAALTSMPTLYEGNSPVTGDFPAQMASNVEGVSIS